MRDDREGPSEQESATGAVADVRAAHSGRSVLKLEGVSAGYGQVPVLAGVSVEVREAQVVAILGPNGAGKTTLLRVASGFLQPTAGGVFFMGKNLAGMRPAEVAREGLCHIPEGRGIFPSLTVKENLKLFASARGYKESVEKSVDAFPALGPLLNRVAGSLSGGEQQMLALGRAYITDPALVLVDEPSMGLAPVVIDRVFDFLSRIAAEGVAVLLVEQYVDRALALAHHVYILSQGLVQFSGAADHVQQNEVLRYYIPGGSDSADS